MNSTVKTALLWVVIIVLVFLLWSLFQQTKGTTEEMLFSDFLNHVDAGRVESVIIRGEEIRGDLRGASPAEFRTLAHSSYDGLVPFLREKNVKFKIEERRDSSFFTALMTWAPVLFLIGLWIFFMRQMQAGGNKALSFGKSKAKLLSGNSKKVTFKDVAGVDEAKVELAEIIEFLKEPQKFTKLGGKIPKGVLLMGPPGTGKTLLARAIAGEANAPFFSISGSDFVEMFVGVGASRVRDLFEQGKKNAPCIIFIDEIDAVGRHRGAGLGGGHDEREQTLNQLLVEMDGFESNDGVILVAATNRPDVLDPALLRPGRFDRRVVVDLPDLKGREGILRVHTRTIPLADDVDVSVLARGTPGFSGADLANLVNESALNAARYDKKKVQMIDFEFAKDKVIMGVERKSMVMSNREKRNTAFHEAGHTIVAAILPAADPLHKVTIIPRGRALGLTQQLPTEDKYSYSKRYLEAMLAVLLGGRIAEELFLTEITTGAGNDIERASGLARKMVCEWGMSDLGPLSFGKKEEAIFLGREFAQHQDYSESTAREIDQEVRRIIDRAYKTAHDVISTH
ncbi:MAG TPA: ATP-dependent zinc metalloprotease FtsH, partial [Thermoanaerobaculia bacterium]|nr:ATP-dependent zinc metalloprotease FtsH [Thermoanaerobaculia bacterium]